MNKRIADAIPKVVLKLKEGDAPDFKAFMGFDACIDNIFRIVREKKDDKVTEYFSDSNQLGKFLINLNNKSCGVELQTKLSKIGGNMVITGNALGKLGIHAECVGTFGLPDILPFFKTMSSNCSLHTVGHTITATALEFKNSKVIMFDPGPYNSLTWEGIKDLIGTDKIREMLSGKQLVSFVNWSEIENSSQIWQGVLDEMLPSIALSERVPVFFTDFSDCSRRSNREIQFAMEQLGQFRKYFKVVLSLNQNESRLVARALGLQEDVEDEEFIKALLSASNTDIIIIHRTKDALAYDGIAYEICETFYCKHPKILTGGGDNFNAGFCFSRLNNFDLFKSLLVANAVAGSYVKTGISPDLDALILFLESHIEK